LHDDSSYTPSEEMHKANFPASIEQIAGDRYEVLEVIGSGGSGVVFKAKDKSLDKIVAIKKLHNSASEALSIRFHREAKILANLKHPNVMSAIDFGLTDKNEPYLILDYVHGMTLSQWCKEKGPMPVPFAVATFIDIAQGLAHSHRKNIVHRDMKPSNVMLVEDEQSKIAVKAQIVDFGLARDTEIDQSLTTPGAGIGTPKYMAPEQIQGGEIDQRTDIYSFGCLMYEVLTGTTPFLGETTLKTINMHLHDTPTSVAARARSVGIEFAPELPPSLDDLIQKCLKKRPEDRFQTSEKLLTALLEQKASLNFDGNIDLHKHLEDIKPKTSRQSNKKRIALLARTLIAITWIYLLYLLINHITTSPTKKNSIDNHLEEAPSQGTYIPKESSGTFVNLAKMPPAALEMTEFETPDENESIPDLLRHKGKIGKLDLHNGAFDSADLKLLSKRTDVNELRIEGEEKYFSDISAIKSIAHLEIVAPSSVVYESTEELTKLPKMIELTFKDCTFGAGAFKSLPKAPRLSKLTITRCRGLKGSTLEPLQLCSKLKYLSLNTSEIDDSTLKTIRNIGVKELKLTACVRVTEKGIVDLKTLPHLQSLAIYDFPETLNRPHAIRELNKARRQLKLPDFKYDIEDNR
jgi:serine/threonine protein kinase